MKALRDENKTMRAELKECRKDMTSMRTNFRKFRHANGDNEFSEEYDLAKALPTPSARESAREEITQRFPRVCGQLQ